MWHTIKIHLILINMIQLEKIRLYDKKGADLQWYPTSSISVFIQSNKGEGAEIYPYMDISGTNIGGIYIKDGGFGYGTYDSLTTSNGSITSINGIKSYIEKCYIKYDDITIGEIPIANIVYGVMNYTDSHGEHKSLCIKDIKTNGIVLYDINNLDVDLTFPTLTFTGALYTDKISTGLVETEHIHMFYQLEPNKLVNISDSEGGTLTMSTSTGDSEIKLFEIEPIDNSVCWCESVEHDIPEVSTQPFPISFNIGFTSDDEGIYENEINLYYNNIIIASFIINSESIGEDERFRALLSNFNIPDPKSFSEILKDSDIKEAKPDWELINHKSKQFFLEYDNIFKFCGTYKGLVNAVKVLGYDDIYFREWFLDTKTSIRKTFRVSYGSDASDTIKTIPFSERKTLKKLNSLSMVYQLNRVTGMYDELGMPIVENVHNSNIADVRIKMFALKQWLEKHIIGINCRITDITAEGVYFDAYNNRINGTYNQSFDIEDSVELTPYVKGNHSNEHDFSTIISMKESTSAILDLSVLETDMDFITTKDIGALTANDFEFGDASSPLHNVQDYMWRANIKTSSSILDESMVTNGLWIYNDTIKIKALLSNQHMGDTTIKSTFISQYKDSKGNWKGNKINIIVEQAYLRSVVDNSIRFSVLPIRTHLEDIEVDKISVDVETGNVYEYKDLINKTKLEYGLFETNNSTESELHIGSAYYTIKLNEASSLEYRFNDITKSYSLYISNFEIIDGDNNIYIFEDEFIIEIIDGKIAIEPFEKVTKDYITTYINFNYDGDKKHQTIECNYTYSSPRLQAFYNGEYAVDYPMEVYHCGEYHIELLTWNDFNMTFINKSPFSCSVIQNKPQVEKYVNLSDDELDEDMIIGDHIEDYIDETPLYDMPLLYNVKEVIGGNGSYSVITESYSYMHKVPYMGAYVTIMDKFIGAYDGRSSINVYDIFTYYNNNNEPTHTCLNYVVGFNYNIGDVIHVDVNIHEKGNNNKTIVRTSCTARIEDIDYDDSNEGVGSIIYFSGEMFPSHIIDLFHDDRCTITTSPAWMNIDNIHTFRIESGTEYEFEGNKLKLDFTNDNYILPYIDSNFDLSIEDFDVAHVIENWLRPTDIKNIVKVDTLFEITHNEIILHPECVDLDNIYIWNVFTNDELIYRVYNNTPSFVYEPNIVYHLVLERIDKHGNISHNRLEGIIKIKETV